MRRLGSSMLALGLALALVATACSDTRDRSPERGAAPPLGRFVRVSAAEGLTPFTDCTDFLAAVRTQAEAVVGPYGLNNFGVDELSGVALSQAAFGEVQNSSAAGGATARRTGGAAPAAPPAAADSFSTTNVQEAGIDEPDTVKTDGRVLVVARTGSIEVVDVAGAAPRRLATVDLPGPDQSAAQLLLDGDRVLALAPDFTAEAVARTNVFVVDIADPAKPAVVGTLTLDGSLVSARLVGGVARVVLHSSPQLPFAQPEVLDGDVTDPGAAEQAYRAAEEEAVDRNRQLVQSAGADEWLPRYRLDRDGRPGGTVEDGHLVSCDDVHMTSEPAGVGMLSVVSVDGDDPKPGEAVSVLTSGQTVYASETSLYVATGGWSVVAFDDVRRGASSPVVADPSKTEIHKFDITDPARARHVASGEVPGRLLDQFSLDEHDGILRVATTEDDPAALGDTVPATTSTVTLLREEAGKLVPVGRVGDLGKGEQIYSARFLDDVGYVVTFRQTDPLYVIDLRDPTKPAVRGELKIPGFSSYLHPLGDGLLLGVGQDATAEGQVQGSQVSLFDVSDPANPTRVSQVSFGGGHSMAEHDHHAFLWWAPERLAVLPVEVWDKPIDAMGTPYLGAVGLRVGTDSIGEVGRITHQDPAQASSYTPIHRSVVVGDRLFTVSDRGVLASDLATLAAGPFLAW